MNLLNEFDAYIFDLDGTLIYTSPEFINLILERVLGSFDPGIYPSLGQETKERFWYGSDREDVIRKDFGLDPSEFWAEYREHNTTDLIRPYVKPYPDWDAVKKLKEMGKKTGIVTAAPYHTARLGVSLIGFNDHFDSFIVAKKSLGSRQKPDPHGLLVCMDKLEVDKENVNFIGNSDEDLLMGRSAGVFTTLIDRKENKIYKDVQPDSIIISLYELIIGDDYV